MASLRQILENKTKSMGSPVTRPFEENIQKGQIYFFNPGLQSASTGSQNFCWIAPDNGTAIIEAWGASGSGSGARCCGAGIPGNPGAYSLKTLEVSAGSYVCGIVGASCGNADTMCFRGCSQPTQLCWVTTDENGCICAMGGRAGVSFCTTDPGSPYCCFRNAGLCAVQIGGNCCGIVCHYCDNGGLEPDWIAKAFGGDVNKSGGFSCVTFMNQRSNNPCCVQQHIQTSPGIFAEDGAVVTFQMEGDVGYSNWSGNGIHQMIFALNSASRTPQKGQPFSSCWNASRACGCYQTHGCVPYLPHGVPGIAPNPCTDFFDYAIRGGHGAVRIKFIGSE
jgi:hypothetical protein